MSIVSMTGFGSSRGELPGVELTVEARSVNHRFLDVNCKLPPAYSRYEGEIVRIARTVLKRGRVDVMVNRSETEDEEASARFNEDLFRSYLTITKKALKIAGLKGSTALSAAVPQILFRREVLESGKSDSEIESEWGTLERLVTSALKNLTEMREQEGKSLEKELLSQLEVLRSIGVKIKGLSEKTPQSFSERLKARLEKISEVKVEPERLAQEVAILADRIDVTEELVRLDSHLNQFAQIIRQNEGGRKLEFLLQEIGREINTTGSKSQNAEITTLVVEAKAVVERLREQVLNVE